MTNIIKMARKQAGKSQCDVSGEAGITQAAFSLIENGRRRPSVETAKRLAAALGVDWTLFFEDDTPSFDLDMKKAVDGGG